MEMDFNVDTFFSALAGVLLGAFMVSRYAVPLLVLMATRMVNAETQLLEQEEDEE